MALIYLKKGKHFQNTSNPLKNICLKSYLAVTFNLVPSSPQELRHRSYLDSEAIGFGNGTVDKLVLKKANS